ncbi:hypothetical protein GIB67_014638 [Kingdonia uniflora]|uniref:CCHC-type domain-containing protein n=1 Tax=Kingdonia uniflora TaxID=39325 RepID=A0A7J7NVX1_9MAGN|nr:hypothetical protein GIB67_014638 [Kingdonia uniflora]
MLELHCISKGKIVVIDSNNALTTVWHNSNDPTGSIHFFVFIIALAPSVPGTPRVMHNTLKRDLNNMANLSIKKTLAKKTVPRNKAVILESVVGNVNMSEVMGDMTVSQVMGDVTVGSGYVGENAISKKKVRATKKDKMKNTETNGQNQPSVMKKKRLRPSELLEEELKHLPLFDVSDDDNIVGDNVEVVGEVPIWEEGIVENGWYDNTCIKNEWYDKDTDEDNADEGRHDDDIWEGMMQMWGEIMMMRVGMMLIWVGIVKTLRHRCSHIKTIGSALGTCGRTSKKILGGHTYKGYVGEQQRLLLKLINKYCSEYHMISSYVKTYSGSVLAISDPSLWDKTVNIEVLPPPLVRGAGRPRKVRRKGDDEGGSQQKRCHKCGHLGHNKKTCKSPSAELMPRGSQPITRVRGGGRPRGNRPKDSFRPRSGVTSELPTQPKSQLLEEEVEEAQM